MDVDALERFVVCAKRSSYVGGGEKVASSRLGSHDIVFEEGDWSYRDSYFGGTDFLGQEAVWLRGEPAWAMNYYGHIKRSDLIDGERAGLTIKGALSTLYATGRFLGGFEWTGPHGKYVDSSKGDVGRFHGREMILVDGVEAYQLDYFGGMVKP